MNSLELLTIIMKWHCEHTVIQ